MLPVKAKLLPTVSRFFEDDWNNLFDWSNRNFSNVNTTLPSVNIEETEDQFILNMAVPGMKKDDFKIELDHDALIIKSEAEQKNEQDNKRFSRREYNFSSFQRVFNFNHSVVDSQKIDATYHDGILCIKLAKKEEAKVKPARRISIK